jgi:hypothetical protein
MSTAITSNLAVAVSLGVLYRCYSSERNGHCDLVVRGDYSGCASARAVTHDEETRLCLQERARSATRDKTW